MLSEEIQRFCNAWLMKANQYSENSIEGCYDKFFTLFVIFNRLYAEATFELIRRNQIKPLGKNQSLPDKQGATSHTLRTIGVDSFQRLYDTSLADPVNTLANLIEEERFHIILSRPDGHIQRDEDIKLLKQLRSIGEPQFLAILKMLYAIRCNMFHGHKSFQPIQVTLLIPAISVLFHVIEALRHALSNHDIN